MTHSTEKVSEQVNRKWTSSLSIETSAAV